MRLMDIVIEASRTSDSPRLNRRAAETVIRAVAEWLEEHPLGLPRPLDDRVVYDLCRAMRDETRFGGPPR